MLTNTSTLKIVHSKSPVHGHDPKFLFPHRYKTVPSVYNKNTSKYELYTPKPSQLNETVQQKCYCKISYGTTFDYYDPEAISQWCDALCVSLREPQVLIISRDLARLLLFLYHINARVLKERQLFRTGDNKFFCQWSKPPSDEECRRIAFFNIFHLY